MLHPWFIQDVFVTKQGQVGRWKSVSLNTSNLPFSQLMVPNLNASSGSAHTRLPRAPAHAYVVSITTSPPPTPTPSVGYHESNPSVAPLPRSVVGLNPVRAAEACHSNSVHSDMLRPGTREAGVAVRCGSEHPECQLESDSVLYKLQLIHIYDCGSSCLVCNDWQSNQ